MFYVDVNCILHQFHIAVREQLQMADDFLSEAQRAYPSTMGSFSKYFASLGKCVNFWREHVSEFIDIYERTHGTTSPPGVNYRQYPMRVLSGRWGCVHAAELFFLERKREFLAPVWLALLSSTMKADKNETGTPAAKTPAKAKAKGQPKGKAKAKARGQSKVAALLDDDSAEAYKIRMSKWASGAFGALRCHVFWVLLRCMNTARAPLMHFFAWCQKNSQDALLLKLVTGKSDDILKEYAELALNLDKWFDAALVEMGATDIPAQLQALLKGLTFKLLMNGAANFNMRIVTLTRRHLDAASNMLTCCNVLRADAGQCLLACTVLLCA